MKTAPQTAKIPPLTREVIAIWEKELDEFVIDIQKRLENIAMSISQRNEQPIPQQDRFEMEPERLPDVFEIPQMSVASEQEPPIAQHQSFMQNETNDRLQAIKQKLAARLQGEAS